MNVFQLPAASPLYEAYSANPNIKRAIEMAVDVSAKKLGADASRLFTMKDRVSNTQARLAA